MCCGVCGVRVYVCVFVLFGLLNKWEAAEARRGDAYVELGERVGALRAVLLVDALPVHLPHQLQHVALRLVVQLQQRLVLLRTPDSTHDTRY